MMITCLLAIPLVWLMQRPRYSKQATDEKLHAVME
jgi:hypothetical protein